MDKQLRGLVIVMMVLLVPLAAGAKEVHDIQVTETAFTPSTLNIAPGDVVRWVWSSGSHKVLSGLPEDEDTDRLFIFDISSEVKEILKSFDEAGEIHFFAQGKSESMTGLITVSSSTPVERKTWGWLKYAFEDNSSPRLRR